MKSYEFVIVKNNIIKFMYKNTLYYCLKITPGKSF